MDEIFGYIDGVVYGQEETGFKVARLKEPKKKDLTLIIGTMPGLQPGETIRAKGEWKRHPKHGIQFEVKSFETEAPSDLVGIQKYLESGMIKGIGPAYAERIVKKFGVETLKVIDEQPEKLLTVTGIGEKRIERIIRCWEDQRAVRSVMIFLRGHGVSPAYAQKIYKKYGDESVAKVRENPFRLAQEVFGIGFKMADQIAQNLGIEKEAATRIEACIEHVLWEVSGDGHVCYPEVELIEMVSEYLGVSGDLVKGRLPAMVEKRTIMVEEGSVWIRPLYLAEAGIARELGRIMGASCSLRAVIVDKALEWVQEKLKIKLAEQQREGVTRAVTDKVLLLTGGPGTGKSTITKAILGILEKLTGKIILAAPTGRAAKRLSEITGKKASTIHSLLEMDFSGAKQFKRNRENPLEADLIIVDEASMIDTLLMHSLLKAVPSHARLILVGDTDQLPSVGPGNVLKDLIQSEVVPICVLLEIFRQAQDSGIVVNAHKINHGEYPKLFGHDDFHFVELESPEEILKEITELVALKLPRRHRLHKFEDIQVLCPMKRGVIGSENLNIVLQERLNPSPHPLFRMGRRFHVGDKVMQMRNNYQKEVFNGDVGYIVEMDVSEQAIKVAFDGRKIDYDFADIDELTLAYAVSVHKYQGSECPCVIIPIHPSHFKLLTRNLLYTGITRGKKWVYLVGTKKAIGMAVGNEEVRLRHTGLQKKLSELRRQELHLETR